MEAVYDTNVHVQMQPSVDDHKNYTDFCYVTNTDSQWARGICIVKFTPEHFQVW